MSNLSGPSHRSVANIRSPTTAIPGNGPPSPHTPLRTTSLTFGSPSALRAEEDCVIIGLGSRYMRLGFAGDALPKAVIGFGPEEQRRAGDYRRWEMSYDKSRQEETQDKDWGHAYEIWQPDLRSVDLGLVGDKIDRAVREAYTKFLLIDSRPRRITMAVPSALPLPLLSTILDTLFTNFQPPTISLMSEPILTAVAAGLRAALVVDVGWAETVVTSVYEYREIQCCRSVRATKMLGEATYKMLSQAVMHAQMQEEPTHNDGDEDASLPSFEECEEVVTRMLWCKSTKQNEPPAYTPGLSTVTEEDELRSSMRSLNIIGGTEAGATVLIPLKSTQPVRTLHVPFSNLAEPCEKALFAVDTVEGDLDDEELPLHLLVYKSLLQLPVDLRPLLMARIVFVGGGSSIPGLKGRVLDDVGALIEQRGFNRVRGKAVEQYKSNYKLQRTKTRPNGPTEVPQNNDSLAPHISAALQGQEYDEIEEKLKHEARKDIPQAESGHLRAISSLGAWSGGSVLSQLKVPAISMVEREQWLQHGAYGASKGAEINVTTNRQSMGPGTFKTGAGDRSSWTLGLWG